MIRRTVAVVLVVACWAAVSSPTQIVAMHLLRAAYQCCEAVGIMGSGGPLGGQVLGFNFQRHPEWVHPVARSISTVAAYTPGFLLLMLLYHRVAFGPLALSATLCGACGRPRRVTDPCACGHAVGTEPPGIPVSGWASRLGPGAVVFARRLALGWAGAVIVSGGLTCLDGGYRLSAMFLELGQRMGGEVTWLGRARGPFYGDGSWPALLNALWRHGPHATIALAGLGAALAAYDACASPTRRLYAAIGRYRGPTLCGKCRYRLAGTLAGRCPECGSA